jgi:hypothetical protein
MKYTVCVRQVLLAKGVKGVEQQQEGRVNDMMDHRLTVSRGTAKIIHPFVGGRDQGKD